MYIPAVIPFEVLIQLRQDTCKDANKIYVDNEKAQKWFKIDNVVGIISHSSGFLCAKLFELRQEEWIVWNSSVFH